MITIKHFASQISTIEIWAAGLAIAASIASERILPIAFLVVLIFWPIRWLGSNRITRRTPLDFQILVIGLLLPVTLWATPLPEITQPQVLRLLTGIALFYAIINWCDSTVKLKWLVFGAAAALLALAVTGLFYVDWVPEKLPILPASLFQMLPTFPGDRIQRTVMGGYLILLMPILISILIFAFKSTRRIEIAGFVFVLVFSGTILLFTLARGAFLGLAVAIIVLALLRWRNAWLFAVFLLVFIIVVGSFSGWKSVLDFFSESSAFSGIDNRLEIWTRAFLMIQDFPITGIGMGTFGPVMDHLYPLFNGGTGHIPHAHNLYLQLAVDLGIPGLLAWLGAEIAVIVCSWQLYHFSSLSGDQWMAGLGAGILASQAAMLTQGMMDAVMWGMVRPAPLVWMVWGTAIAGWNIMQARKTQAGLILVGNDNRNVANRF